jgi:hypothetical protein
MMSGKGDKRRPGKGYGEGFDNIDWSLSTRMEERERQNEEREAKREEVRMVGELLGFTDEQIEAILEEEDL